MKRLVRGLASNRKWARVGYSTALTQVIFLFVLFIGLKVPDYTQEWASQYSILWSTLTSVANGLLDDARRLDNELSPGSCQPGRLVLITVRGQKWKYQLRANKLLCRIINFNDICLDFRPTKTTGILYNIDKGVFIIDPKFWSDMMISGRVSRCNFTKNEQWFSHCFHLHAQAPSVEVPGWVDERIDDCVMNYNQPACWPLGWMVMVLFRCIACWTPQVWNPLGLLRLYIYTWGLVLCGA